jgi:hypothetical protein
MTVRFIAILIAVRVLLAGQEPTSFMPGGRVLLDAHNAYPYEGRYMDRVERALSTGLPVAIEQDVAWCPAANGAFAAVVTHDAVCRGNEPTLGGYFFERIAPIMDDALRSGPRDDWPLVTLNLDFKTNQPELHEAVWQLLGERVAWLTTAPRLADESTVGPLAVGPLLVLTGEADSQATRFHDRVPVGERLRLFGAVHTAEPETGRASEAPAAPARATNYRRWWNNPWKVVEAGGPPAAGPWTPDDQRRLEQIVASAHRGGLWIRFYTLDGFTEAEGAAQGWFATYSFGGMDAAETRWRAAVDVHVDFVATDQYETLSSLLHGSRQGTGH